jgi:hypothetical protein
MAVVEAIRKHVAGGGDQAEFLGRYFKDIREWGGIQTAINEGIRGGGFQRAQAEAAGITAETARQQTREYLASEEGVAQRDKGEIIATQRERASKYAYLCHIQRQATQALIASGKLEEGEGIVQAILTGKGMEAFQGDLKEQEVRRETARMLTEQLRSFAGGREYLRYRQTTGDQYYNLMESRWVSKTERIEPTPNEGKLAEAANELKRLRELAERQRDKQESAPLVRPAMPASRTRMGG